MSDNKKDNLDDITKKVRKAAKEGNVTFATDHIIDMYPEIVNRLLDDVLQHPEAFISDMSCINDFCWARDDDEYKEELLEIEERLEAVFGVKIEGFESMEFGELVPLIELRRGSY